MVDLYRAGIRSARWGRWVKKAGLVGASSGEADVVLQPVGRDDAGVLIRIEARDLPGLQCGQAQGFPGYSNIHVGVQRRERRHELLVLYPGDAPAAVWELETRAVPKESGWDLLGPYVQGGPGGRFVYLSWGTVDGSGTFTMFRRAKLWLDGIPAPVLDAAVKSGLLVARLGLIDARGQPLCASVRPPLVEWLASAA